jgi:predicted amidohydrolase
VNALPTRLAPCLIIVLASIGCQQTPSQAPPSEAISPPAAATAVTLVREDGSYPAAPLEKDEVVLKVVQNGVKNLQDYDDPKEGLAANVDIMLSFIERACTEGDKPDIILFNEFPLTGYSSGSRAEKLKFTLTIPGPETDLIGKAARACDSYIVFGSYATDADWPNHILSLNAVIDRQGNVAARYWKTRNVKRLGGFGEIPTTTVENVRSKFRARYGIEEEFPVLQTEFGNLAVSTVQIDAFVYAAYAMRGVEIMLRTATLFSKDDVTAMARFNNFYSAMSNITFPEGSGYEQFGGGSLIVDAGGKVLEQDPSNNDSIIEARIPIAEFRKDRRIPRYPLEVVAPVFEQYRQEIPLDHLDLPPDELPQTGDDMKVLLDERSRWLNPAR